MAPHIRVTVELNFFPRTSSGSENRLAQQQMAIANYVKFAVFFRHSHWITQIEFQAVEVPSSAGRFHARR